MRRKDLKGINQIIGARELIEKAGLTERQVRFIIAYYYDDFYEREVAEQEGCSRPTVSVDLSKAKEKLAAAGFPVPHKQKRPEEHIFDPDKLNTLHKREGGYYSWLERDRP